MAAACRASTFFLVPLQTPPRFSRKSLFVLRCSATSPPLIIRLRKPRKNHLRPKILKTRPEPVRPEPSLTFLVDDDIVVAPPAEYSAAEQLIEESWKESEPLQASVSDVNNVVLGKSSKLGVFKIGLFLVGAFVFQTICAVWLFGSGQNGILEGDDKTRVLGLNGDGVAKSKILLNGSGMLYVDEPEVQKKISEIQAMARDVREKERREVKNSDNDGLVDDDDDVVDVNRIEKEVLRRLEKLGKGVKKKSIKYVRKDNVGKEVNGALKAEFENSVISPIDNAKGFQSLDDNSIGKFKNSSAVLGKGDLEMTSDDYDGVEFLESVQKLEKKHDDLLRNDSSSSEESDGSDTPDVTGKKVGKRKERVKLGKVEPLNGKVVKLDESNNLNGSSSPMSAIDKDTSTIVHKDHSSFRSDSENTKVGHTNGVVYKKSVDQTDSWWLTLPYVLAIVMRTGGDDEEDTGLYTIKCTFQSKESSHVVAFEDRGDATNFCYLLQSFFQDMDDFSTDVIPIPIKELDEAVKSHAMKVIVVKKGQLGLYAGRPLSDIELTLRSLLE